MVDEIENDEEMASKPLFQRYSHDAGLGRQKAELLTLPASFFQQFGEDKSVTWRVKQKLRKVALCLGMRR